MLTGSGTLAPRDDGPGVAHAPSRRGSRPSDEAHHRLLRVPVLHQPLGGIFLSLQFDINEKAFRDWKDVNSINTINSLLPGINNLQLHIM